MNDCFKMINMRKILTIICLGITFLCFSQNKLDFNTLQKIDEVRYHKNNAQKREKTSVGDNSDEEYHTFIVSFQDKADPNSFLQDFEIMDVRGTMCIIRGNLSAIEKLAENSEVVSVTLDTLCEPQMLMARSLLEADEIHRGILGTEGLKFTGKGVITGIFDEGLDINHVNFKDSEGRHRTKVLYHFLSSGSDKVYEGEEEISGFTTDSEDSWHGTHVLGIMAGGYSGVAQYAVAGTNGVVEQNDGKSAPYYGVAPESDIIAGCGPMYTSSILKTIGNIIDYSKSRNQPCVINLSCGTNTGPHDGTSAVNKYLAEMGKEAIICIAAGNEGDQKISFSTIGEPFRTLIESNTGEDQIIGGIQLWGSDDKAFTVHFIGYELDKGEVFRYTLGNNLAGRNIELSQLSGFNNIFDGRAIISSNINTDNNRYSVSFNLSIQGKSSSIYPGIIIEPIDKDQIVDGFSNTNTQFVSKDVSGFSDGSADNSINEMACGDNVIVVGSYGSSRNIKTVRNQSYYMNGVNEGDISDFSSYGKTPDNRYLPDVCAPGASIISSYNRYYVDKGWFKPELSSCIFTPSDNSELPSYWAYGMGTSMATPMVAGTIALWLEADPTLDVDDIKELIRTTSTQDSFTAQNPKRWGAGKINALEGIRKILGVESGVESIPAELESEITVSSDGRVIGISTYGDYKVTATLHNLSGMCVKNVSDKGSVTLSAEDLAPGIYLLRVVTINGSKSRKVLIR